MIRPRRDPSTMPPAHDQAQLGATPLDQRRCRFCVWAPAAGRVTVCLKTQGGGTLGLERDESGYHRAEVDNVAPGDRYTLRLDDGPDRPDPASRFQPEGVHGPSEIVASGHDWTDAGWVSPALSRQVLYELHVGTYTKEGTFEAIIPHLDDLKGLGVTTIELMPIAQFPGSRNWGYDGVGLYAAQNSYGGPGGLKRLVNAAHRAGLGVVLDVVYNHLGPEGNYLAEFGPYFTDRYCTPWGKALNFDGPDSDEVRRYFVENALYWVTDCRLDGLRLDAVHAIIDPSARPFIAELAQAVHQRASDLGRRVHLYAESSANDPRLVRSPELGGTGMDAQWNDDFHHALQVAVAPGKGLPYAGYDSVHQLAKAYTDGYVLSGEYNTHFRRRHGAPSREIPAERFVVFSQNHDQVGNQRLGERLSHLTSFEGLKVAAGLVLVAPYVPMLFMGEEHAETAPFLYFISHTDPDLVRAVRKGRLEEFRTMGWTQEPPDPQAEETFERSRINHALRSEDKHRALRGLYKTLLSLRRSLPPLALLSKDHQRVEALERERALVVRRWSDAGEVFAAFHFGPNPATLPVRIPSARWRLLLDSADALWAGPGAAAPASLTAEAGAADLRLRPMSFALYARETP
jgi:maltooligosyltrehalose trehalohydrolase